METDFHFFDEFWRIANSPVSSDVVPAKIRNNRDQLDY